MYIYICSMYIFLHNHEKVLTILLYLNLVSESHNCNTNRYNDHGQMH